MLHVSGKNTRRTPQRLSWSWVSHPRTPTLDEPQDEPQDAPPMSTLIRFALLTVSLIVNSQCVKRVH
ncbi:unnamed protein product [Arctogadus glacialis]